MATLNIKGFPDDLYEQLQRRALAERRSVAQEVIHLVDLSLGAPRHSILELRGLGRDSWRADGASHVAEERRSWES